ncbi:Putative major facilitator superfamily, MFS transporter superfamily [Septoria linicola]|uniref:Major facilitator superfamily, MFS transporter superfamily n=1 Tax=Septoria linicola TaxID=215465 RepID=A0A9Q9EL00_9PEZI|nr:Putative major facilitator superfamily, MFS transporter superfamily [Septoria linicola]
MQEADEKKFTTVAAGTDTDTERSPDVTTETTEKDHAIQRTRTQSSSSPLSKARTISLVIVLTGAAFLNTLSVQACVIILPTIGRDLNIPSARQQWIVSAYSLTFGCFLLLWGRLADVYGKRLIFLWGSAWVCVMTLVCPFIPNEIGFDVFRGLQGLGAAANIPTAIGILGVTFPPGKAKNYAFATYSAGAPLGSVFGNFLGGLVGQYATWKWVFWVLAIMAALVTIAGHFLIPLPTLHPTEAKVKHAVDWPGGVIITVGLVILLFALTDGNVVGWSRPWIPVLIVLAILLVAAFICWQLYLERRTTRRPLMKVTIFKNVRVSAAMLIMTLFFSSFNGFLVFATYFYQDYQGLDAIHTTIRFIPTGVVGVMTIFVTSQLLALVKVQYILMFAAGLFAIPIPPDTTYWAWGFPAMCLSVFGADTLFPSLLLLVAHSLPREDQALGGAMVNAVGQIGRSVGLAIATAIQVAIQENRQGSRTAIDGAVARENAGSLAGLRGADWFNFATCLAAFIIATVAMRGAGKVGAAKH